MSPHSSKPPLLNPCHQSLLALDDTHPNQPLPDAARAKCVELLAGLLRAVVTGEIKGKGTSHD